MIKRILVALDPDSDTPVAVQYATEIARRYEATVTGLAVIDLGEIEAGSRGGGIGSMYYADKLRERLTEETRAKARDLVAQFEGAMEGTDVRYANLVEEGVPFQRIVEDMNYHDLLVVGDDPHFFYSHPKQRTDTLARVVKETVAPTLIVESQYQPIRRVVIAYDGSQSAARTMQRFVHLQPFGTDLDVHVLTVQNDDREGDLLLRLAGEYLEAHGFAPKVTRRKGSKAEKEIVEYVLDFDADLVVAGAHSVSALKRFAFGSTTAELIERCPVSLFLHH